MPRNWASANRPFPISRTAKRWMMPSWGKWPGHWGSPRRASRIFPRKLFSITSTTFTITVLVIAKEHSILIIARSILWTNWLKPIKKTRSFTSVLCRPKRTRSLTWKSSWTNSETASLSRLVWQDLGRLQHSALLRSPPVASSIGRICSFFQGTSNTFF